MACCEISRYFKSTLGTKVLMAVTGVILLGYCVGHVSGNMLVFAGEKALNDYAAWIHSKPAMLWAARVILLVSVIVHIVSSIRLTKLKADARPVAYEVYAPSKSTMASRTMMFSGPFIAFFVVYHILHLTLGAVHTPPNYKGFESAYRNVVFGFQKPAVAITYLVAMAALWYHLSHGIWSMFQTIGANNPRWDRTLRCGAVVVSALIALGFSAVPVSILAGFVK